MKQFAPGKCVSWFGYAAILLLSLAAAVTSVSAQPLRIAVGAARGHDFRLPGERSSLPESR